MRTRPYILFRGHVAIPPLAGFRNMSPFTRLALLAAALAFVLSACGRSPAPAPAKPGAPAPAAQTTLTFWHIITYTDVLDKAVARFEQAHPGVKVKVETFDNDSFKQKLNVEMASGSPPDVFFTWGGGALQAHVRAGRVLDLTDAMNAGWADRFVPAALDFGRFNSRLYAAPLDLACVPVWYNAALFEKHNAAPPKTWDEFMALCARFRAAGVTPLALGNRQRWPGAFYFVYLAARLGGTDLFINAASRKPGASFEDAAFIAAGERLVAMTRANCFGPGVNGVEDDDARTRFLNGEAAMYLMGTWVVARAQKERPEFLPNLRLFPFPAVAGGKGDPSTVVGGVNCAFAVSKTCKQPGLAVELLKALTAPEVAEAWAGIGRIPAVQAGAQALERLPQPTRDALALLQAAKTIQPYYDQYLPPRLAEVHKDTTLEMLAGALSPADAAPQMEQAARREK